MIELVNGERVQCNLQFTVAALQTDKLRKFAPRHQQKPVVLKPPKNCPTDFAISTFTVGDRGVDAIAQLLHLEWTYRLKIYMLVAQYTTHTHHCFGAETVVV